MASNGDSNADIAGRHCSNCTKPAPCDLVGFSKNFDRVSTDSDLD